MRTLTSTLESAQQGKSLTPALKLTFSKSGEDDVVYTQTRILSVSYDDYPWRVRAEVKLGNSDGELTSLDFKGWTAVLSYGLVGKAGAEYSDTSPMKVTWQQLNSAQGVLNCELTMVGIPDLMDEDEASETYFPTEDDTETIKALLTAVAGATLDCYSHCTAYTIVWDSDEDDDALLLHQPKDSFRIPVGGSRLAAFRRLLERTGCVHKFGNDGKIHIFVPTTSGSTYDYEYSLATGHVFFSKAYRKSLVIPNKIVVQSESDDDPQYSGEATHAVSYALLPKTHYVTGTLADDDEAEDIAQAIQNRYALNAEMGAAEVPMNVGAELYDYVKVTDSLREGDYRVGNLGGITRIVVPEKKIYNMRFNFGDPPSEAYLKDLYQSVKREASSSMGDNVDFDRLRVKTLYAERILLDDILDTATYKRVLSTQISAGKILLSDACEFSAGYNPSEKRRTFTSTPTTPYDIGDLWLDATTVKRCTTARASGAYQAGDWTATTLDAIADGATYGLVYKTDISAGHILLSACIASGSWYDESGVEINADTGINIYGTANALTTRATKTGTIQCYVGADGAIYAGAGAVYMDADGLHIKGEKILLMSSAGGYLSKIYIDSSGYLIIDAYTGIKAETISPKTDLGYDLGASNLRWNDAYINFLHLSNYLDLPQRTSHPTAVEGRMYLNSSDHNIYAYINGSWQTLHNY
jgi:hypothetical protein